MRNIYMYKQTSFPQYIRIILGQIFIPVLFIKESGNSKQYKLFW